MYYTCILIGPNKPQKMQNHIASNLFKLRALLYSTFLDEFDSKGALMQWIHNLIMMQGANMIRQIKKKKDNECTMLIS